MTAKPKPYPAYKDSGMPWLGRIPVHWDLRRTKYILCERNQKGFPDEPLLAATQTKGVVRKERYENRTVLALKDLHLLKLVRVGDFVISLRSFQGGIEYAREQGIISPAYTVLYSHNPSNQRYLAWLFKSKPYIDNLALFVTGIRQGQNIDYGRLSRSDLPLPPADEQIAIARFLDYIDRRTRRYVRAQRKLISLLEEQKQAIIQRAVTRGLDPNVRLKPSGVEWLGEVSEHWDIRRLKYLFREIDDRSQTGSETLLSLRMYRGLVPHNEVSDKPITSKDLVGFKHTRPKEIVMNRMRAALGMFAVTPTPGIVSPDYAIFRRVTDIDPHYYAHLFKTPLMRAVFRIESKGLGTGSAGFLRLYSDRFGRIKVPRPPYKEQVCIAEAIAQSTQQIDSAITQTRREIELIREYRTRLIADVVTGKLDVRQVAANLPDETEEPEDWDADEAEEDSGEDCDEAELGGDDDE